jgi:hypothetical protein
MKKQGAFDGAAELLEDTFGQWVGNRFDKQVRLAARLLRVAGRTVTCVGGDTSGTRYMSIYKKDLEKLARIIHQAQELPGKSK